MADVNPVTAKNGTIAVMDLGSNTFHLLIARGNANHPEELCHITEPVKLGEGGINAGIIKPDAYKRGIDTMLKFHELIQQHQAGQVIAIATSALRTTSNGRQFIDEVRTKTGIAIQLVDGGKEAEYIYQGIKAGDCLDGEVSLILDIGGGSVEFILGNDQQVIWKRSFEVGAIRLMEKFHKKDPIPASCIQELDAYLEKELIPFFKATETINVKTLIGASGAFESYAEVIERKKGNDFDLKKNKKYVFDLDEFITTTDWLIESTHFERENTKGIIEVRVDMIVVAAIVTRFVMEKLGISKVIMSTYSLKEGVLAGAL